MSKKITSCRVIYLLILGAVIFVSISACGRVIYQHPTSLVEPSANCRVIQHAGAETCIPTQPQRIVTLDIFSLGNAVTLGVKPIAGGSLRQEGELPEYLKNHTENIEHVGTECQPNIEKLISLKPDLILGRSTCIQQYELFSKIAPTVLSDWYIGTHWRENFDFTSDVLGEETSSQAAWNQYYQRIKKLRSILNEKYEGNKISVVEIHESGVNAYTRNSFSGTILSDLKLQRSTDQDVDSKYGYIEISEEELEKIDGDILFIMTEDGNTEQLLGSLRREPLWQKLQAVQTNQAYVVKSHVWWGGNLLAANLVLDDLEKYLVNTP